MATDGLKRFDPDLDEFGELQRAFWRRVFINGMPALLTALLCVAILPAVLFAGAPWWLIVVALPAGGGAILQLGLLWLDRPTFSVKPTAVEVGAGVLRFVDEKAGTVEELRWKREAAVSVRRANDAVEITLPSGRRNRVHWFAYENREELLKELMALEQEKPASGTPPAAATEKPAAPSATPAPKVSSVADRGPGYKGDDKKA